MNFPAVVSCTYFMLHVMVIWAVIKGLSGGREFYPLYEMAR